MTHSKIIIHQPSDLFKAFRKELFKNPFFWFCKEGYKLTFVIVLIGLCGFYGTHHFISTIEYGTLWFKLFLLSIVASAIYYPIHYLSYMIDLRVIISESDIWIKRSSEIIKFKNIRKVILEPYTQGIYNYWKIIVLKNNGKTSLLYSDDNDIHTFIQSLGSIPITNKDKVHEDQNDPLLN